MFAQSTTIKEKCCCGATFYATGSFALSAGNDWREKHSQCPRIYAAHERSAESSPGGES